MHKKVPVEYISTDFLLHSVEGIGMLHESSVFHLSIHSVSISRNSQDCSALVLSVDTHNMRKFLQERQSEYSSVTAKN
jgi:hypothetical protein